MAGRGENDEPVDARTLRGMIEKNVPEMVRRVAVTGLGALFMTEEGLRGLLADLKLPKEAITYLAKQSDRTKDEFFRIVQTEFRSFLERVDLTNEMRKVLSGMALEITTEIHFKQVDQQGNKLKPTTTKMRARIKRRPKIEQDAK